MTTIEQTYINALLADASYADTLVNGASAGALTLALSERMTPTVAKFIGDNFEVASHAESSDVIASGFDATVWRGRAGTPYAGKIYVSMQGTEGLQDFLTDAKLAFTGNAGQQVIDMVNWWLKITTPVGQTARQLGHTVDAVTGFLSPASDVPGTGLVTAAELVNGVEVNGHSLGGYLAAAFTRLFGTQAHVTQTTTFNSAGFALGSESAFVELTKDIGPGYGLSGFAAAGSSSQLNYFAEHGLNFTTNSLWFSQVGQRIKLFNEESPTQIGNHFMYKMTDVLALVTAMEKLDPSMSLERANELFEAGSNTVPASIEGVVNGLRRLLLDPTTGDLPAGDIDKSSPSRVTYYQVLQQLTDSNIFKAISGKVNIMPAKFNLASVAQNDFGALAALVTLSPVLISGNGTDDAPLAALWNSAVWNSTYTNWQNDKNLSQAERDAGKATYSDNWLQDRAILLDTLLIRNNADNQGVLTGTIGGRNFNDGVLYEDVQSGTAIRTGTYTDANRQRIWFGGTGNETYAGTGFNDHLYGGLGNDILNGQGGADYLEGDAGNDSLSGGADSDKLFGGAGADTLEGGAGSDLLSGGEGIDTYNITAGEGFDAVMDSDGQGSINLSVAGTTFTLNGGSAVAGNPDAWVSADGRVYYSLIDSQSAAGQRDLIVSTTQGAFKVASFTSGQLGIQLGAALPPVPHLSAPHDDVGDQEIVMDGNSFFGPELLGGHDRFVIAGDQAGTILPHYVGQSDLATHANAGDELIGGGGNDFIASGTEDANGIVATGAPVYSFDQDIGADRLEGGAGVDILSGGNKNDRLIGGAGADFLFGGRGADALYGGAGDDVLFASHSVDRYWVPNATWLTADEYDVLSQVDRDSGRYARFIPLAADEVEIGRGQEWQIGIRTSADGAQLYRFNGFDVVDTSNLRPGGLNYQRWDEYVDVSAPARGDDGDLLDGGAGNDLLIGSAGANVLLGGEDNDTLYGRGGADVALGGGGNDYLRGDGRVGDAVQDWSYTAVGEDGDDYLDGEAGNDTVRGGGGNDVVLGGSDQDLLWGDAGNDRLEGGAGNDQLTGDDAPDMLISTQHGNDTLDGGAGDDSLLGGGGDDVLSGGDGNDWLSGEDEIETNAVSTLTGNDQLDGGEGSDTLVGGNGNDSLVGGAGDDMLFGGNGDDVLTGGAGLDALVGGAGNDTYVVCEADLITGGSAAETITDNQGVNKVVIAEGAINAVLRGASANDLVLGIGAGSLLIRDGLAGTVETIELADGSVQSVASLTRSMLNESVNVSAGAAGSTLVGGKAADSLSTSVANTRLEGAGGNDTYSIDASRGGVTVVLQSGDGHDRLMGSTSVGNLSQRQANVLEMGEGITSGSLRLKVNAAQQVLLAYGVSGDDVGIDFGIAADGSDAQSPFDLIRMASGEQLSFQQLLDRGILVNERRLDGSFSGTSASDVIVGSASNDLLLGRPGNDLLDGGGGNDSLVGGAGADTYIFGAGAGRDRIAAAERAAGDVETLRVVGTLAPTDIRFIRAGDDLLVEIAGTTDEVRVEMAFAGNPLDAIVFDSGARIEWDDIHLQSVADQSSFNADVIYGGAAADVVDALAGNDTVWAGAGADDVAGGDGDDSLWGESGSDHLSGDAGGDTLNGGNDADVIDGGAGNDVLDGGDGDIANDTLSGGTGDDQLFGRRGSNTYIYRKGDGADRIEVAALASQGERDRLLLTGISRNECAFRRVGADLLVGLIDGVGGGVQLVQFFSSNASSSNIELRFDDITLQADDLRLAVLSGSPLDDTITGTAAGELLAGGAGNDSLDGAGGNDTLDGGIGNDWFSGGAGDDTYLIGLTEGHDFISADAGPVSNELRFKAGVLPENVTLTADATTQLIVKFRDSTGQVSMDYFGGARAIDRMVFSNGTVWTSTDIAAKVERPTSGNDLLHGSGESDAIDAVAGSDTVFGYAGNDMITWAGSDVIDAGDGDDLIYEQTGANIVGAAVISTGQGNDIINQSFTNVALNLNVGDGTDLVRGTVTTLNFGPGIAPSSATAQRVLVDGVSRLRVNYGTVGDAVQIQYVNQLSDDVALRFADGSTTSLLAMLSAAVDARQPTALGTAQNDAIGVLRYTDRSSAPYVNRAVGSVYQGGAGNDTLTGGERSDVYLLNRGDGVDTINESANEYYSPVDVLRFGAGISSANVSRWVSLDQPWVTQIRLDTGEGVDVVQGAIEQIEFSDGSSVPLAQLATSYESRQLDATTVEVAGGAYVLPAQIRAATLRSSGALFGNALDNALTGSAYADMLDGGMGVDTMQGCAGNDTYVIDNTADVIIENAGEGTDLVQSSATYSLAGNIENLTLTGTNAVNGTGNALANTVTGNGAANRIDGGSGADTMIGGAGDDIYVVDSAADVITESASGGTDTVESNISWTLGAELENVILTGANTLNATGNAQANTLRGNSGINVLNGGAGADSLIGGAGNDTYIVDNAGDVVTENASEGVDLVQSSVTFTLAANVENLTLTGTSVINGTGNTLANVLTGNGAANRLDGGTGADTMIGGTGNDTYVVDNASDVVTEAASGGTDTIESSLNWTLSSEVENLTLTGTANLNGTGNSVANTLRGNAGDNVLTGGAGNDSLLGGAGNDTYVVDVTTDVITENASEGTDLVQSAVTWTLGSNLENLTLTGTTAINGTGNTLDNVLTGNSANNTLTGAAGNDTLDGGLGNDTMVGGIGNDTYVVNVTTDVITENSSEGTDTVQSAVAWTLSSWPCKTAASRMKTHFTA